MKDERIIMKERTTNVFIGEKGRGVCRGALERQQK
jgi:hypothetical protein